MGPLPKGYLENLRTGRETGPPAYPISPFQLWLTTVKTGRTRKLSMGETHMWFDVRFGPEGKQLLAYDGSDHNIALVDVNYGSYDFILPATLWKKATVWRNGFDWDSTGRYAYVSLGHGEPQSREAGIWQVDLTTGNRRRLTKTRYVSGVRAAPSGQWLAFTTFVRNTQTGEVTYPVHVASLPDFKARTITKCSPDDHLAWSRKRRPPRVLRRRPYLRLDSGHGQDGPNTRATEGAKSTILDRLNRFDRLRCGMSRNLDPQYRVGQARTPPHRRRSSGEHTRPVDIMVGPVTRV